MVAIQDRLKVLRVIIKLITKVQLLLFESGIHERLQVRQLTSDVSRLIRHTQVIDNVIIFLLDQVQELPEVVLLWITREHPSTLAIDTKILNE